MMPAVSPAPPPGPDRMTGPVWGSADIDAGSGGVVAGFAPQKAHSGRCEGRLKPGRVRRLSGR